MIHKMVAKNLPKFKTVIGVPLPLADTGPICPQAQAVASIQLQNAYLR